MADTGAVFATDVDLEKLTEAFVRDQSRGGLKQRGETHGTSVPSSDAAPALGREHQALQGCRESR